MKQSEAWAIQIRSDFAAAELLYQSGDERLYCQVIAKYQQVAEKSVKAMAAAINDQGVRIVIAISPSHMPNHEIDAVRRYKKGLSKTVRESVERIFSDKVRARILALCGFAPRWPKPGQHFGLNTEYPYNHDPTAPADWKAPADTSFTLDQVQEARELVWVLHRQVLKFIDSTLRAPR